MRTWEDYKAQSKSLDNHEKKTIEEVEMLSQIISTIIQRRQELGMTQRGLAELCGIPQSSVARIETLQSTPKIDTLLKLFKVLNLKFQIMTA